MKSTKILLAIAFCAIALNCFGAAPAQNTPVLTHSHLFTQNVGQVTDQNGAPRPDVKFIYSNKGFKAILKENSFSYEFYSIEKQNGVFSKSLCALSKSLNPSKLIIDNHRVDIELLNSNPNPEIIALDATGDPSYFYKGQAHGAEAHSYATVIYKSVYPGIDIIFHAGEDRVKYDLLLHSGARLSDVKLAFNGMSSLQLENGKLLLQTTQGNLTEEIPGSYMLPDGNAITISYKLENNELSFTGNYPSGGILRVDPALRWATLYGGSDEDDGTGVAADAAGNVYLSGATLSTSGIATSGAYQTTQSGNYDAFLVKFNSKGARLWATYYGGDADIYPLSVTLDASGKIILAGYTSSSTGVATSSAYQTSINGFYNGFFAKFTSTGALSYATYYGGDYVDIILTVKADANGYIYLGGLTESSTGIATSGAYQTSLGSSSGLDGFFAKFNSSGNIVWGTYYGGSGDDGIESISIDPSSNVYVGGIAASTNAISTSGAFQTSKAGGTYDGFVAKFNSSGSRQWGTYYGTLSNDVVLAMTNDLSGNLYIAGQTDSTSSNLATSGAFQTSNAGGNDGFLARFSSSGSRSWGTYFGGSGDEQITSLTLDLASKNYIYAAGYTNSSNGIASSGAYQTSLSDTNDAFFAWFSLSGSRAYSTYFGGSGDEGYLVSLAADAANAYIVGSTSTSSGMATSGAYQTTNSGGLDAFLFKMNFLDIAITNIQSSFSSLCPGSVFDVKVALENKGNLADSNIIVFLKFTGAANLLIQDTLNRKLNAAGKDTVIFKNIKLTAPGTYSFFAYKNGNEPQDTSKSLNVVINPLPKPSFQTQDECFGQQVGFANTSTISSGSISSYLWKFGDGGTSTASNPTHNYSAAGTYTVSLIATSDKGCQDSFANRVNVFPMPSVSFNAPSAVCLNSTVSFVNTTTLSSGTIKTWKWKLGDGGISSLKNPSHTYSTSGTFTVTLIATTDNGCIDSAQKTISVGTQSLAAAFTAAKVCRDSATTFTDASSGATAWSWYFGDNSTSSIQNPTHIYTSGKDSYLVSLVVSNSIGCKDSISKYVRINAPPVANFGYRDSCDGKTIIFLDSSADFNTFMTDRLWDFGDTKTENKQFPAPHSYSGPGSYTVKLTVKNLYGCTSEITKSVTVNTPPSAAFTSTMNDSLGNFTFTAGQSGLLEYMWSFGDKDSSKTPNSTPHKYADTGKYNVTLCVTGSGGCISCSTQTIHVYFKKKINGINDEGLQTLGLKLEPNPFDKSFNLDYTLTKISKVRICISDLQGREINLITEGMQIAGNYRTIISPNMSAGVYILRMNVDGQTLNQRIVKLND